MKSKTLSFNSNYTIFENGDLYSEHSKKFLRKLEMTRKGRAYFRYQIRNENNPKRISKKYLIQQLMYFHFCNHEFKGIDEMPSVFFIDNDSSNFRPENLTINWDSVREKKKSSHSTDKVFEQHDSMSKIKISEKEKVAELLKQSSKEKVAWVYKCSVTSLNRFLKRVFK